MLSLGLFLARDLLGAELPVEVSRTVERDFGGGSVVARIVSELFTESIEPFGDSERVIPEDDGSVAGSSAILF